MWYSTAIKVLLLLCIQHECMCNTTKEKNDQKVYAYHAHIDTRSSASDERLARWSVCANLTVQRFDSFQAFQLTNVKVNLYNGLIYFMNLTDGEDIPAEAEVLLQPFSLYDDTSISVTKDEPLWSLNLKRGIAQYFIARSGELIQKSIFGNCEVIHNTTDVNNIKTLINHNKCTEASFTHLTNVRPAPAVKNFNPIQIETEITGYNTDVIESWSNISYKLMPSILHTQNVDQYQKLELLSSSAITEKIDVSHLTVKKQLIYEYGSKFELNRHKFETDTKVLVQQFLDNYKIFEKRIKQTQIEHHVMSENDPMEKMYMSLYLLQDKNGFEQILDAAENEAGWKLYSTFITLLPYIGTTQSVDYIIDLLTTYPMFAFGSPFYANRILAIFPEHIQEPDDDLIQKLENLIHTNDTVNTLFQNNKILCFSSVIRKATEKNSVSEKVLEYYKNLFNKKFFESEDYVDRMVYLLALVNIADSLTTDYIISIIINSTELSTLRSLALTGFNSRLSTEPNKVFSSIWPLVQNGKENFDVRVKALDVVLSSNLTEEQFNIVLETCKTFISSNVYDRHLANYFITSIEGIENTTHYRHPLDDFAKKTLENENFPFYLPWSTGNYRFSYTDAEPNFGGYFQARLIADPHLNLINFVQISFNRFAMSFDMGTYSIYLNIRGHPENNYYQEFIKSMENCTSVPDLLKIIKQHDFKIKSLFLDPDIHVEIILFVNDHAVWATFFNSENSFDKNVTSERLFDDLFYGHLTISYPLWDYIHIPSILGSPIIILNEIQDISLHDVRQRNIEHKMLNHQINWLGSYNPILDTAISSYKYYGNEKYFSLYLQLTNTKSGFLITNDSFNWVWDNLAGTAVSDKDILGKFCSECETIHEIPTDLVQYNKEMSYILLGMFLNHTQERHDFSTSDESLEVIVNSHHNNANSLPYLKPLLLFWHYLDYNYYINTNLERGSYRSTSLTENPTKNTINFDFTIQSPKIYNALEDLGFNISIQLTNKDNATDEYISQVGFLGQFRSRPENKKAQYSQTFHFYANEANETRNILCISRELYLPNTRLDKFSLTPLENSTVITFIYLDETNDTQTTFKPEICKDKIVKLTEIYHTTNEWKNKIKESKEYKQCKNEAVGLTYTPPLLPCFASFLSASQYETYELHVDVIRTDIVENFPELKIYPFFNITRIGSNKLKYSTLLQPLFTPGPPEYDEYLRNTIYTRSQMFNPTIAVHQDYDIVLGLSAYCTISTKITKTFTGTFIPNDGDSVAFVECHNETLRGMTTQKISDTQIGFKLWSKNNTIDATVDNNKLKLKLNGEDYDVNNKNELLDLENYPNIRIRFWDDNIVLIADDQIIVYYNTEYITIKSKSPYNSVICGVCSQDL